MLDHTNPSQHTLHRLQKFYTAGNSSILLDEANNALQEYPHSMVLINFISAALSQLGQYEEAISKLLEAIELNPNFPDSYNNLGTTYLKIGDVKSAIGMFKAAIDKNPEYAIAHRNLAKAYNENNEHIKAIRILKEALELEPNHPDTCNAMGQSYFLIRDFPLAIDYFMKAIKQNPSFFEAYNNLGSVFTELGNAESAAECFIHSLKLAPNYLDAKLNLTELLKTCKLTRYLENETVALDNHCKVIGENVQSVADKSLISKYILSGLQSVQLRAGNLNTPYSQLYRRNTLDLNCKRHTKIFHDQDVIPKFCFSCFKVQINIKTILDLIKLSALFYDPNFKYDITRKCMIELRPNVNGFYKGFLYCRDLNQADEVSQYLSQKLSKEGVQFELQVKRGCSEFSQKYRNYGEKIDGKTFSMKYPDNWKRTETKFDKKFNFVAKTVIPSLDNYCLSDFLIIQKWVDYAKGIGDPTASAFASLEIQYQDIYQIAKNRVALT